MRTPKEVAKVCIQNIDGCEFESEEIEVLRCIIKYRDSEIRAQAILDTKEAIVKALEIFPEVGRWQDLLDRVRDLEVGP